MKIEGTITGLTTHNLHDGELVIVTLEGPNWSAQAQTKDAVIGAEWKKEHEADKAQIANEQIANRATGKAPVLATKKETAASAGKSV